MSRREQIEALLIEEPEDAFLRYALALELEKEGEHQRSLELLQGLMKNDPPHVPSFFMAGQHLAGRDELEEAREVLREGIEQARLQKDSHAAAEMSDFLGSLGEL